MARPKGHRENCKCVICSKIRRGKGKRRKARS
jgi:hypothetical protein